MTSTRQPFAAQYASKSSCCLSKSDFLNLAHSSTNLSPHLENLPFNFFLFVCQKLPFVNHISHKNVEDYDHPNTLK